MKLQVHESHSCEPVTTSPARSRMYRGSKQSANHLRTHHSRPPRSGTCHNAGQGTHTTRSSRHRGDSSLPRIPRTEDLDSGPRSRASSSCSIPAAPRRAYTLREGLHLLSIRIRDRPRPQPPRPLFQECAFLRDRTNTQDTVRLPLACHQPGQFEFSWRWWSSYCSQVLRLRMSCSRRWSSAHCNRSRTGR